MGKKWISMILALGIFSALSACATKPAVFTGEKDGVKVTAENVSYKKTYAGDTLVLMDVTVENQSGQDLSEILFDADYLDSKGNLIQTGHHSYSEDDPVRSGESVKKEECRFVMKFDGKTPSSLDVRVTGFKTLEEKPLDHVPQEGEYLYLAMNDEKLADILHAPPKEMEIGIDQMGYLRKAVFVPGDGLEEAVDLFSKIRIGTPDAPDVTDNYNYISFTWEDGSKSYIHIDLDVLTCTVNGKHRTYALENLAPLFSTAYARFEDQ